MMHFITLIILLSVGNFNQREQAEHNLKVSGITFEYCKAFYDASTCPEFRLRMKRVLWVRWCDDTAGKYEGDESYFNSLDMMQKLQRLDFQKEFRLKCTRGLD